jgi:hypothetical protein
MLNVMTNFDTNCYHSALQQDYGRTERREAITVRPGVTHLLLIVIFTKKEDIFL